MKQYILAHRGASGYAPENTLEAFELAQKMGADGVELDVHLTRDGELVVAHDETVDRVSDGSGWIRDMRLAELKRLHFNKTFPQYTDARIPTLREVFELLKPSGMEINIELKNSYIDYPDLELRVIELIHTDYIAEKIIFSSFNHHSMLRVKKLDPSFRCGLLYEANLVEPWNYAKTLGVDALHPHFSETLVTKGECAAAHALGIEVNTWTVNEEEYIRAVLREGADRIITNYPDRALKILKEEYK